MTTAHATGTALRAGAFSILLATTLLGAPAIASALPSDTGASTTTAGQDTAPVARPCANPRTCLNRDQQSVRLPAPELTGSNSATPAKATNLVIWGDHFHPGDGVYIELRTNDGTRLWQGDKTADDTGHVNVVTSRGTDNATPVNGYAVAYDTTGGWAATNRLPIAIKGAPAGPVVVDNG